MNPYTLNKGDMSIKTWIRMKARIYKTWFPKTLIEIWMKEYCEKTGLTRGMEGALRRTRELVREDKVLDQKELKSANKIKYALYRYL